MDPNKGTLQVNVLSIIWTDPNQKDNSASNEIAPSKSTNWQYNYPKYRGNKYRF
jgi:hypothetical protein